MTNPQVTSTTVFFEVEYKVTDSSGNDGAWTAHSSGSSVSVAPGASAETLTHSISVGEKITWRYRTSSQTGTFSGSYTEIIEFCRNVRLIQEQVKHSHLRVQVHQKTRRLLIQANSYNTAYFNVQYKSMMDHIKHTLEVLVFQ